MSNPDDTRKSTESKPQGLLWALPSALVAHIATPGVDLGTVQRALEPFRKGKRRSRRIGAAVPVLWPLDAAELCVALGLEGDEIDAVVRTLEGTTASRLAARARPTMSVVK